MNMLPKNKQIEGRGKEKKLLTLSPSFELI